MGDSEEGKVAVTVAIPEATEVETGIGDAHHLAAATRSGVRRPVEPRSRGL